MHPFVLLQRLLPQHGLTALAGALARCRVPIVKRACIRLFLRLYRADLAEAAQPDPDAYPDFQSFFTRPLRPDARPLPQAPDALASPCDGRVSQAGRLDGASLLQAKGIRYDAATLLGDATAAAPFTGGMFATVYLAPADYHRVHMPFDGQLTGLRYVPGALFSVSPTTVAARRGLFSGNERLVCLFETCVGPMAVVLVGAMIVGGIRVPWAGRITPRGREGFALDTRRAPSFRRGDELAVFEIGSTVITCLPPGAVRWTAALTPGARVRMGQTVGRVALAAAVRPAGS